MSELSSLKKKKKKRTEWMNDTIFSQNPLKRGKSHHHDQVIMPIVIYSRRKFCLTNSTLYARISSKWLSLKKEGKKTTRTKQKSAGAEWMIEHPSQIPASQDKATMLILFIHCVSLWLTSLSRRSSSFLESLDTQLFDGSKEGGQKFAFGSKSHVDS